MNRRDLLKWIGVSSTTLLVKALPQEEVKKPSEPSEEEKRQFRREHRDDLGAGFTFKKYGPYPFDT